MKIKLKSSSFYKRHDTEISRFLISEKVLHIVNQKSKNKIKADNRQMTYINFNQFEKYYNSNLNQKYDVIILTDVIEDCADIYSFLKQIKKILKIDGKLIITSINTRWRIFSKILESFKLKDSTTRNSYIHQKKIKNIANGLGLEYINSFSRQYIPFELFGIGNFLNKFFELIFFKFDFGIKTYSIFRNLDTKITKLKKTIIIPAKNEEGNLIQLFERIPNKDSCEIIFSLGKSTDKTYDIALQLCEQNKKYDLKIIEQTLSGKANAVWEALSVSKGQIVAILDADISVEPEILPSFFEIIEGNNADFVNGTRLIYEMEKGSMRFINKIGNRLFQFIIGNLINVKLTDSLCGTKVFKKDLIQNVTWWQNRLKMKDPFGDFDLIFSAAYTGRKILELPVNYKKRKYGKTQISRFKDGFRLLIYISKSFVVFNSSRNS